MNYIETLKGKYLITEQGRSNIRSLLAYRGTCLLNIAPDTGWNYQKLYRIYRGMQSITMDELKTLSDVIHDATGHGIIELNCSVVGRLS